ncbi:hypothetical protein QZH41_013190 [Actinostola sp. cb2023]|nr:hypothetical protein QZH41_013190 [Actinostola sp. cb2023]
MYTRQSSKRFCFLLVLLVLGQEFNHVFVANALINHHDNRVLNEDVEDDVVNEDSKEIGYPDRDSTDVDKRWIHGALFAASIATSLISLGIDVLIKVKGCSIFYPSIKRYLKEFDRRKKTVGRYMLINNKVWKYVNALKDWVQQGNDRNAQIWLELQRIDDVQKAIVELLSPEIIKKFNIEEMKLKQSIEANNRTVLDMSLQQLTDTLQSPFDSAEDTAVRLSGITGLVGIKIATSAFKYYKIRQISKMLRSSYGAKLAKAGPAARKFFGFSKASMNLHIKQTSKSMYKAKFSGAKYGRFMKGAGSVMSVVSIAMDVYSIIQKIRGCRRVRDRARNGVRDIRKAEDDSRRLYNDLRKYMIELYVKGVIFIKTQLFSKDLHNILQSFKDLANSAPREARDFRSAAPIISRFQSQIRRANLAHTRSLQKQLIGGLKKLTLYYRCYLRKLQLVKYVTDQCKIGTASMQDLFNQGNRLFNSNSLFCRFKNGIPYTSFKDVKDVATSDVKAKNLNPDCILNNQAKKKEVCSLKDNGYKPQVIATKARLSVGQVEFIIKTCPEIPITPVKVRMICSLRKEKDVTEDQISKITGITVVRLATVKCA